MAADNPREAVRNFVEPLQDAVLCVANAYVNVRGGYFVRPEPHVLTLNNGEYIPVSGPRDISFSVSHDYNIVESEHPERGPWKVASRGYIYTVSERDVPVFAYHWHPTPGWDVQFPHLHLYLLESIEGNPTHKAHFPTGRVSLESVIRLLIREFDVEPLRTDYTEVLNKGEEAFIEYRLWA
jgi:hypothetical protein